MSAPRKAARAAKVDEPKRLRRQYAALPFRRDGEIEVLLVSSRETRRWVLPKGWPMKGRKPHAAAKREALEEAGVVGRIAKTPVGDYHYVKRLKNGAQQLCSVTVFPMEVDRQRKRWQEMDQRTTRWFPLQEAVEAVDEPELRRVLKAFETVFDPDEPARRPARPSAID